MTARTDKPASTRRRSKALGARRYYLTAAAVTVSLGVIAAVWSIEPRYRASMGLALAGKTFPVEGAGDARGQLDDYLRTKYEAAAASLRRPYAAGLAIADISTSRAGSEDLRSVSARFEVFADAADARASKRAVEALTSAYLEDHRATVIVPPVSAAELERAQADLDSARVERERLEQELAAFERDNAAVLPGLEDLRTQALEEARREMATIEQQIQTLEARRNELDRGLGEMQRGASRFSATGESALTSEIFTAAQARWAVLRGLYGDEYSPAAELGAALSEAREAADARFSAVSTELEEVRNAFESAQRRLPLDHPDVISLAHRVSALERLVERTRISSLSNRDLRYIENLARERREIDGEIDEARERRDALEAAQAEEAQRAEQAPMLAQQHVVLQQKVADARDRHERAAAHYASLQNQLQTASLERPGELSVVAEANVNRIVFSWPLILAAMACLACFPVFAYTLRIIERKQRTVCGSNVIARLQGKPPLAEIPELGGL